jgi:RNA polymerase sigma-70 factor (ECF subfamily)
MHPALALPFRLVGDDASSAEQRLVARLRSGELMALGEAYDAHHEHVRAFARRMVGEDAAAEDLVQETFLALPRAVARFRGESSLRAFLVSVAVNHARHHVRAAARHRAAVARMGRQPPPASPTPADEAARAQLAEALLRALDTLPLEQRVAIVLCEVEERTSREAALITGVPEATVRTRVFHAKRKLVEALAKEGVR